MHQCDTMGIGLPLYASLTRKIRKATCSLNIFELTSIHSMKCKHYKFQNKRFRGLIKIIAVNFFMCFLILLSINLICNFIKSLILLRKVSLNNELALGIATCVCCSNNVKWDIFIFNVFIKVLLSVYKGEIMQHRSGHNDDEGICQGSAQSQMQAWKTSL